MTPNDYTDGRIDTAIETQTVLPFFRDDDTQNGGAAAYSIVALLMLASCIGGFALAGWLR
jgi:hypothetical protein